MRRLLVISNLIVALVLVAWGVERYLAPEFAIMLKAEKYQDLMFKCDHVMREHFIAKQMVLKSPNDQSIRNLDSAEIGLTACHEYDKLRKSMISWGVTENRLASIGLEAIEKRATDIRKFVEIHEIRY